jgi:hypothetical protein
MLRDWLDRRRPDLSYPAVERGFGTSGSHDHLTPDPDFGHIPDLA